MRNKLELSFLVLLTAANCLAGATNAITPEIDPTTGGPAIALLSGGLLAIRYRRKK